MAAPLYSALQAHRALGRSSFHTPGHKSRPGVLPDDLYTLDLTELPDTDSLYKASGPILEAEKRTAALFGAARTCLSAGGCTLCIQAMLRMAAPRGGSILCSRTVHRSAVNAMALLGIEPVWALPDDVLPSIEKNPQIEAVYVTSPNYYGQLMDIPALAAACKKRGIPLLVDNAHGTHLMFTSPKLHPLYLGADMTADSPHKTLGVLTGGAWLQVGNPRYADGAKQAMALFGSTSPGYPVMASLDLCREWLEQNRPAFPRLQKRVQAVRELAVSRGIRLPEGPCDPTRITLDTASVGIPGTEAADFFRKNSVEPEYADARYVVLIATPFNTEEDFARLSAAISRLPAGEPLLEKPQSIAPPPVACSLREAVLAQSETVPLGSAPGRTAAETACPCPPGIPVVMPGEKITKEAAEFLHGYGFSGIKVLK